MILAFFAFVSVDFFISLTFRKTLIQREYFLAGAASNFIYHLIFGIMYLDTITNKNFLLFIDVKELYSTHRPASSVLCFFMVLFHSWAFAGGRKDSP